MNRTILLITLLSLTHPLHAEPAGHPVTLWEVSGTSNSVYLLGSIHLLRPQDYPLPRVFDTAYKDAEVLIMEVDADGLDPIATQSAFIRYGVLQGNATLRKLMGETLYQKAHEAAEAVDIPLDMLNKTEPWYAAMTVEIMMLSRIGFDATLGIEMHMMSKAEQDAKPIEGFETVEEQIQFLDNLSLPAQRAMLLSTLTEGAELDEMMDELIDAWRHGDVTRLEDNMLDELAKNEELNKVLVIDRNTRWVTRIEALLDDEDDYLIIVGALHLIGPHGVPRQLQDNGHVVRQLSESAGLR